MIFSKSMRQQMMVAELALIVTGNSSIDKGIVDSLRIILQEIAPNYPTIGLDEKQNQQLRRIQKRIKNLLPSLFKTKKVTTEILCAILYLCQRACKESEKSNNKKIEPLWQIIISYFPEDMIENSKLGKHIEDEIL